MYPISTRNSNSTLPLSQDEISEAVEVIRERLVAGDGRAFLDHVERTINNFRDDESLESYDSNEVPPVDDHEQNDSDNEFDEDDGNPDTSIRQILGLHPPVAFATLHCPPLSVLPMRGECDCPNFGIYPCILEVEPWATDVFAPHMDGALGTCDDGGRIANHTRRKGIYGYIHSRLDFEGENTGRKELPNCACAKVRQIYPNADGNYMGFLDH
jgi:hypothetical protein